MKNSDINNYDVATKLLEEGRDKEAFENYLMLAEKGFIHAQVMVGWLYQIGRGVKQDIDKARFWYGKTANANSPDGQFYIGSLYRLEGKYEEAITWLIKAAAQGYMPALYRLGKMYDIGEGVAIDKEKSYKFLEEAAIKGHLFAKRELSVKMMKGESGVINICNGFLRFIDVLITGIKLGWKDPYSELIRK